MNIFRLYSVLLVLSLFFVADLFAVEKRVVAEVVDGMQHVDIVGGEYYFEPNVIVLKINVPVEFRFRKEGGFVPHDFIVAAPEAGIDFNVDLKSDWNVVTFTPTRVGSYAMTCQKRLLWFESHEKKGMKGLIEVVP